MQPADEAPKLAALAQFILGAEVAALALPAIYTRIAIAPAGESLFLVTLPFSLVLAALAFTLFEDQQGTWQSLLGMVIAHAASIFLVLSGKRFIGLLLTLSAAALVLPRLLLRHGFIAPEAEADIAAHDMAAGLSLLTLAAVVAVVPKLMSGKPVQIVTVATLALAAHPSAPSHAAALAARLLPISEFRMAHETAARFLDPAALQAHLSTLGLVAAHCQISIGYVGVSYLRTAQLRKNSLLQVGADDAAARLSAAAFSRSVGLFMLKTALPYMLQRTFFESINELAKRRLLDLIENEMRIGTVLSDSRALESVAGSNHTVSSHAEALRQVLETPYRILERKIFSLPKMALLPGVLASQPTLVLAGLPLAVLVDGGKSWLNAKLTAAFEGHRRRAKAIESKIHKIEAHDLAHAAQISSANAFEFTRGRWRSLMLEYQAEESAKDVIKGLRNWLAWLYWQDVLQPGIEVGLAWLLEAGHIGLADVWLFARVIEDAIDFLLMRSRQEAQLAMVVSDAERLAALDDAVREARAGERVFCSFANAASTTSGDAPPLGLRVQCDYTRGSARVRVGLPAGGEAAAALSVGPGVYALSGPNGSGKSTLLSILTSCAREGAMLSGITLNGACQVQLESAGADDVVEVHQRPYCPLSAEPITWLARGGLEGVAEEDATAKKAKKEELAKRAATLAVGLRFRGSSGADSAQAAAGEADLAEAFLAPHDDFCGGLSGGQRAKLELIRAVFLQPACPKLLLLDEPFAALDAASKALVMRQLREFCPRSIVLVVYHPDREEAHQDLGAVCDAGGGRDLIFFDAVLEVRGGELGAPKPCPTGGA